MKAAVFFYTTGKPDSFRPVSDIKFFGALPPVRVGTVLYTRNK